ncbi:hypothetical protein AB6A40_000610 [Gnathostoma spinigerum]|uniref:Uncharacterized protein n=1 Tax=Gnathostoma spinigerum TaxID=75299 RepID=A0ABD6E957_9BILA
MYNTWYDSFLCGARHFDIVCVVYSFPQNVRELSGWLQQSANDFRLLCVTTHPGFLFAAIVSGGRCHLNQSHNTHELPFSPLRSNFATADCEHRKMWRIWAYIYEIINLWASSDLLLT